MNPSQDRVQRAAYGGGEKTAIAPPPIVRNIEAAFQDLFNELDCLSTIIFEIEERLKPILAPSGPEQSPTGAPTEAAGSFVMGQLYTATAALSERRARLRELGMRVEL